MATWMYAPRPTGLAEAVKSSVFGLVYEAAFQETVICLPRHPHAPPSYLPLQ